ncbi:hypothetical protein FisN_5Lh452 [Fistulifera solaris]|uniref:Transcriptional coactivator p15 (PC4) C-terminal domain-containing protein n=1 Tax=Fistulifera solaris TaxID=1519565 RepID=A0A1Z5KGM1_FISSO|nr:hypothetical protein FisN_5Lh452 [Fistulifera solaris]|eukprot:GAX25357.1 hypothetical protein FisN_5Lh452 [Fistulifera solaris]
MSSMEEPKPKKAKTAVKEEHDGEEGDRDGGQFREQENEEEDEEQLQMQRNENGELFLDLSRTRRLTVRKFKSAVLVDIREYYEKDDKILPGKKGISLSVQQYEVLKKAIMNGTVDKAIREL